MTSTPADPSPPLAHPPAAATAAADGPDLQELIAAARAWCLRLVRRHLDPSGRAAVASASKACRLCVLEAAQKVTFTLLSYSGMAEAAWQRRLAAAEADLCARGPSPDGRRCTKLLLRFPTHNTAALFSALGLSPAAREAVTELELREHDSGAAQSAELHTAWLRVMPAAFPTLHTLRLDHMCGRLPSPALLPHLRVLHVVLRGSYDSEQDAALAPHRAARCVSIAPYLPQLISLTVWQNSEWTLALPWAGILTTAAPSLTHFSTNNSWADDYIPLLLKHAPRLQHLTGCLHLRRDFSGVQWGVKSISVDTQQGCIDLDSLVMSPVQSSHVVTIGSPENVIHMYVGAYLQGREGLSDAVQKRMHQWQFTTPCHVYLDLTVNITISDLHVGLEAALRQLSGVLPAGSIIEIKNYSTHTLSTLYPLACAAITAAGPSLTHTTVLPPTSSTNDEELTVFMQQQPPLQHSAVLGMSLSGAHKDVPWPWQSLHILSLDLDMSQLLHLPDPAGGQYDVHVQSLIARPFEWTPDMLAELKRRLQHWTLVISHEDLIMRLSEYSYTPTAVQPASLRGLLQALSSARWRPGAECCSIDVNMDGLVLSHALISELSALPTFGDQAATLSFDGSHWVTGCQYESLPSTVPACYSTWELKASDGITAQHLIAICRGARARSLQFGKLTLRVEHDAQYTDEQRSQVEACTDQEGLGRWVEVEWELIGE